MELHTDSYEAQLALRYGPITLEIEVTDPEMVTELLRQPPESRDRYAKEALRLGILAMRMANGHVDAAAIRSAGEKLIADFRDTLVSRGGELTSQLTGALKSYFDPDSGMLSQRLRSLVEQDGDIERALRRHVGGDDSALAHTLARHLGDESPLFRLLAPDDAAGLRAQLERTLEEALGRQREAIVGEFSLDRKDSALRRLIEELEGRHAELRTDLKGKVDAVVSELTLDRQDSALSRLVSRVERAQKTITDEFSLDKGDSALSRMSRQMGEFQAEVREALVGLGAKRAEAKRSTRHGFEFQDCAGELLAEIAQRLGDVCSTVANTTGTIKNCKVGDHLIELGPESPAPGARIIWETKQQKKFDLRGALDEMERARKNRSAQVGVFVFSAADAPDHLEPLARYGDDLIVMWDPEDPGSEVVIRAAYTTARALALRVREVSSEAEEAADEIERATRTIEKQLKYLGEIQKMAETARASGDKIADRAERMRQDLSTEIERIDRHLAGLLTIG
jgi:hypothetical protein